MHNRSRWDRTKWYTIDYNRLAELVPETPLAEGPVDDAPASVSTAGGGVVDEAADDVIDGEASSSSWKTKGSSKNDTKKRSSMRACASEPGAEARQLALETAAAATSPETAAAAGEVVNELDVAYEAIPASERQVWYQRADRALEAAGVAEWMRITAVVKEAALRLWVGTTIPALASG